MQLRSEGGALVGSDAIEKLALRKIYLRLLPFAVLSYILAYVDRINISFAALTMRGDLNMSASAFGFAAGMFFWGYFIFEVPSNMVLERVGARVWIARIMISWGVVAGLTALVVGTTSFVIVRFLLGVCEAGFFPGLLLYFTYWFPSNHHARIVSGFMIGLPIAVALGAPVSTALLSLDGLFGLRGWQVMYIAEAIPTVLLGILTLFLLTDRPEQAKFLTPEERDWLTAKLTTELTMIPYLCGVVAMVIWGRMSDRMNERRWHLLAACVFAAGGLILAGMTMGTWWALAGMSIAAMGFYGSKGPFFAMPPMFLSGTGLAAGIAWINSLGNLGGFFGPWYVGLMKDWTASYSGGLYGLALTALVSAFVCAFFLHIPNRMAPEETMAAVSAHAG